MSKSDQRTRERLSVREAAAYTRRGFLLWWRAAPELFLSSTSMYAAYSLNRYLPLYCTARLVNELAGNRDPEKMWTLLLILLAAEAVTRLLAYAALRWYYAVWEGTLRPSWDRFFFEKLLSMDFCDVDDPRTQALLTKIKQDNDWSSWGLNKVYYQFYDIINAVCYLAGALALSVSLFFLPVPDGSSLVWLNQPWCPAAVLVLLAASVIITPWLHSKGMAYFSAYDGAQGNREFRFFSGIATIERKRSPDIRIYEQDRFFGQKGMAGGGWGPGSFLYKAACGPMGAYNAAAEAVSRSFSGAVYLFVGLKALGGAFGVGSVTQYVGALSGLTDSITRLLNAVVSLKENAEFLRDTFQFLDTPNNMYQGSLTTEKRSDRKYEIEFRDVSFKYPGTDVWALRHMSMKFKVGERLAVVGENGSGKTTFIKLLCRLYDPTEGEILLNGIDIRKYRYDNYLALFSVVFQDFRLLSQPLGQNVAASIEYDRERAAECLERAGFGERLAELPKGLDTCLYRDFEDDGVEISGGEAQKIALARVLYQDAPFIVLDEPTAALDPEAEAEVYTKFNDIVEDKTAIYISHRLSSCRFCDEIAVFDHGQVVQQGTHDSLLDIQGGKYQTLWDAQAQYYQKKDEAQDLTSSA